MTLTGNVPFVNGSLSFSGNYPNDYAYASPPSTFNQLQFTIGVGFRIADLGSTHDIVVGGFGARWMMLDTDTVGNVSLVLNNHAVNIPLGFAITAGTDHALQVSIDTTTLTVITRFDGVKYTASIPAGFVWNNGTPNGPPFVDQVFTSDDFSRGQAFPGLWHWMYIANGILN